MLGAVCVQDKGNISNIHQPCGRYGVLRLGIPQVIHQRSFGEAYYGESRLPDYDSNCASLRLHAGEQNSL